MINVTFNGGTIEVLTGRLSIGASNMTLSGGNFTVSEGAVLDLSGGGFNRIHVGTYTGSGDGIVRMASGLLAIGTLGAHL